MVIVRIGAALAACVVLACTSLGGACCAELTLERSDEQSTYRLFYSVRKLTWAQADELCNLSSVASEAAAADAANVIASSTLLELTRRQRSQFENAWVVSSRGGRGSDCFEVVVICNQSVETKLGLAGCAKKMLSVTAFDQKSCLKRTKSAVICHQEHSRPTLSTESFSIVATDKTTAGKQVNRIEGNGSKPTVSSNAHGKPTQASRVEMTGAIATMLADVTTTDRRSRAHSQAGGQTTLTQSAAGHRILWATSALFKGLEKGEKAMLGLILGCIGAIFVICAVAVALFCIHPRQRRVKQDAQSCGSSSNSGEEAFPLLPVADRQADMTVPIGSVTDGQLVSPSAVATTNIGSDDETVAARATTNAATAAVSPAGCPSNLLDGCSQPVRTITDWHSAAAVPPSPSSPSLPGEDLKRRNAADETAETQVSSFAARTLQSGDEIAAAPIARVLGRGSARQTPWKLSVVHDLSEGEENEDDQQSQLLSPGPNAHQPSEAAVPTAVADAAAAAARRSEQTVGGCGSTSSASGQSRFVSVAETHSDDNSSSTSSGRSRSSSTASSDTWWPPADFGIGSSAGDSYLSTNGLMVTAL